MEDKQEQINKLVEDFKNKIINLAQETLEIHNKAVTLNAIDDLGEALTNQPNYVMKVWEALDDAILDI